MKKVFALFLICLSFTFLSGFGCKNDARIEKIKESLPQINLNYWRITDDAADFSDLINAYMKDHPYVTVSYKKLRLEEYKQELINAWSEDRGPDIFSIPATWMGEYISKNRLSVMPPSTKMTYEVIVDAKKGTKDYVVKTLKSPTAKDIASKYVSVVPGDVIKGNDVYGLPLSIDTLVLYYNRDLLDVARISEPPLTWSGFKDDVKKLTIIDKKNNVIQAGASLGTINNVNRSFDIASLLMMQNGSTMSCGESFCIGGGKGEYDPGMEAMSFYADFANPNKDVYTWNATMPNSLDAFADGKVAYTFGYSYNNEEIKAKNPSLNYYINSVPQIDGSSRVVNYANYFVEVVPKKSLYQNEAWDFLKYISDEKNIAKYLTPAKKASALRSVLSKQQEDPDIGIFAKQAFTAKDWYHGKDYATAESVLNNLASEVLNKQENQDMKELEKKANENLNMTW